MNETTENPAFIDSVVTLRVPGPKITVGSMIEVINAVYEENYCDYWITEYGKKKSGILNLGGTVHNYKYEFEIKDSSDPDSSVWLSVNADTVKRGLEFILNDGISLNKHLKEDIRVAVVNDELGALDSEAMDVIIQAGIFGEIIYG